MYGFKRMSKWSGEDVRILSFQRICWNMHNKRELMAKRNSVANCLRRWFARYMGKNVYLMGLQLEDLHGLIA